MISAEFSTPRFLERAKAATVTLTLRDGEYGAEISSGTYTLYTGDRTAVTTGAVTVTGTQGVVSYALLAGDLTVDPADDWQEEWTLTLSNGDVHTIRRDVFVCRRLLYPVVSVAMLLKRVSDLLTIQPNPTPFLEEAWDDIQARVLESGKLPYLTLNPWAFKRLHLATTLHYIYRDAATYFDGGGRYATEAEVYRKEADAAFGELRLEYDKTENLEREDAETNNAGIYANTPAGQFQWGRNGF